MTYSILLLCHRRAVSIEGRAQQAACVCDDGPTCVHMYVYYSPARRQSIDLAVAGAGTACTSKSVLAVQPDSFLQMC
eukprot:COSAG01_NODE_9968_length_2288_cov_39.585199_3_plen_76_part_01